MNPVWFSTVALVRFLLGRVSDGLRGDEMDGWIVASESSPPPKCISTPTKRLYLFVIRSFEMIFNPL